MKKIIELKKHERKIQYCNLLSKIATLIFVETSSNTSTGNWCLSFEEIEEMLDFEQGFITEEMAKDIEKQLLNLFGEFISYVEIYDETFDISIYDNYIAGFIQDDASYE